MATIKIQLHISSELTSRTILELISLHKKEINRLNRLDNYFNNKPAIKNRTMKDHTKPNNKLVNNYARYITTMATGYFLGVPVQTRCKDEDFLNRITAIYKYNDETDLNTTLAINNSKYGYSYELHYMDEKGINRIAAVDPREIIYITNNSLNNEPTMVIRYFELPTDSNSKDKKYSVEVYTKDSIKNYILDGGSLKFIDENSHPFNDIPIIRYVNNDDETGDYETVIELIDAYDKAQSDTANDFEYFTDAYLKITGESVEPEQALMLKEQRVFNFPEGDGDVSFVTKNIDDSSTENYKARLDKDIHKFSLVPNMTDENFVGNSSGVAMAYKLQGLEFLTGIKEQKFRKGLLRRVELLANVLSIRANKQMLFTEVEFIFTRNNPENLVEIVETVTKLVGTISNETQLDLLPMIDKDQELKRLEKEKHEQQNLMDSYDFNMSDDLQQSSNFNDSEVR